MILLMHYMYSDLNIKSWSCLPTSILFIPILIVELNFLLFCEKIKKKKKIIKRTLFTIINSDMNIMSRRFLSRVLDCDMNIITLSQKLWLLKKIAK